MAEYIKREEVYQYLDNEVEWNVNQDRLYTLEVTSDFPAADVAEVRHGRWVGIEYDGYADGCPVYDLWECSECGEEVRGEDVPDTHPWCHACGARMDKEDEHEAD